MTSVAPESGRLSGFLLAKQSGKGVFAGTPTNILNPTSFDAPVGLNPIIYETLNGQLDSEVAVRNGVIDLSLKTSFPAYTRQGWPFIKGGIGTFVVSGASSTSFPAVGSAGCAAGANVIPLAGAAPTAPAGAYDWNGAVLTIGTGATQEDVPCYGVDGSNNLYTWPTKYAHVAAETVVAQRQVCFFPNTGNNRANLDYFSAWLQYAALFERQLIDLQVAGVSLKGDDEKLNWDLQLESSQDVYNDTTSLTTAVTGTGEGSDVPTIQRDGGLATYWAAGDTYPKIHDQLTALQWDLNYKIQKKKVGGGVNNAMQKILASRSQKLTWSELAGTNGALSTIYSAYAKTATPMHCNIAFKNPVTGDYFSIDMPRVVVTKYDAVGPNDDPISWNAEATPLLDKAVSGLPFKVWLRNGVFAY